ncbi:MAG TPA: hypothetical protein VFF45_00520 [Bacilli bacterium]|jgi:hypothetical protein|nr:hypothetical protein [Bacilli bacterium]
MRYPTGSVILDPDIARIHGRDERLFADVLGQGAVALHELVRAVAGRAQTP